MNSPSARAGWRVVFVLLVPTLFALVLRLLVLDATFPVDLSGDERNYYWEAKNLVAGNGYGEDSATRALRPPGHAIFLSLVLEPDRDYPERPDPATLRDLLFMETALGTALVFMGGLLGFYLFDTKIGVVTACIVALYPTSIAFSHYLWSETLFSVLIVAAFL